MFFMAEIGALLWSSDLNMARVMSTSITVKLIPITISPCFELFVTGQI